MNQTRMTLLLLLAAGFCNAQDLLKKNDGSILKTKVSAIDLHKIQFKHFEDQSGPDYFIDKSEVAEIRFANGRTESFRNDGKNSNTQANAPISLEDTQKFILEVLNKYAHDPNSDNRRFQASFKDKHLFLALYKKNGKVYDEGTLYDLSSAVKFNVDRRHEKLAYLNVHLPMLEDAKKNQWDRIKLVIGIDQAGKAVALENAMTHYKNLLNQQNKGDSLF